MAGIIRDKRVEIREERWILLINSVIMSF